MQQHSAQHVLSAAFISLFDMPTVSFHMADDYCSIDLDALRLTAEQVEAAERRANEIIVENCPVEIRYAARDEALQLGLRKPPADGREKLRLIDIQGIDLSACGGTHVNQTGQIAGLLLRKFEKVRQGWRVEFVAGQRAVTTARHDFNALTETAALFSSHIYDVPTQASKSLEEIRSLRKRNEQSLSELAAAQATTLFPETPETNGRKLIVHTFSNRDLNFLKLVAQKLTRQSNSVIALLATDSPQPALVFAQSPGQAHDMSTLLKQTVSTLNGRGGGSKDLAQGGISRREDIATALAAATQSLKIDSAN
jgi:alanyl-tRNA synthetase